ncbi:imidazole glycerol phosphate synthase subunit HisH [Phototrophicus methaneseepsis]|uniref:Imidazole glycerol phosphate synthase subunit HisH n=1 Tax=Phototrophicus methaneseepsis TaxID=2710758 RepID=A0A7S8E5V4_9CHLR|nr:imidazole glycerol phosphate synthase subunit HisH [Phototrophicus methaneseepsis]QPC80957.1 imidazole glycerol phosphate synthase subunit HisH [Phototrophicus methaneseepsis]
MLAVIDYGAGNLRSVLHALNHLGAEHIQLVQQPEHLVGAEKIILPGVGAFGAGMQQLRAQELVEPLKDALAQGIPYLGICLGMQFLFETSNEMGTHEGLGVLPGRVERFPEFEDLKVPHMGWNQLQYTQQSALLENLSEASYAYFVHSYYCLPADESDILIEANYGIQFCAGVQRDNIYGVQFHPEKSQQTGLQILQNFLALQPESGAIYA